MGLLAPYPESEVLTVPSCPGSFVSWLCNKCCVLLSLWFFGMGVGGGVGREGEEECHASQPYCASWSGSEPPYFGHQIPSASTDHTQAEDP